MKNWIVFIEDMYSRNSGAMCTRNGSMIGFYRFYIFSLSFAHFIRLFLYHWKFRVCERPSNHTSEKTSSAPQKQRFMTWLPVDQEPNKREICSPYEQIMIRFKLKNFLYETSLTIFYSPTRQPAVLIITG